MDLEVELLESVLTEPIARLLNLQTYQTVLMIQNSMPSQVMRQQPVYLEDARGFPAPFHLEFVTSLEVCFLTK